jgi:hypothetical protein
LPLRGNITERHHRNCRTKGVGERRLT